MRERPPLRRAARIVVRPAAGAAALGDAQEAREVVTARAAGVLGEIGDRDADRGEGRRRGEARRGEGRRRRTRAAGAGDEGRGRRERRGLRERDAQHEVRPHLGRRLDERAPALAAAGLARQHEPVARARQRDVQEPAGLRGGRAALRLARAADGGGLDVLLPGGVVQHRAEAPPAVEQRAPRVAAAGRAEIRDERDRPLEPLRLVHGEDRDRVLRLEVRLGLPRRARRERAQVARELRRASPVLLEARGEADRLLEVDRAPIAVGRREERGVEVERRDRAGEQLGHRDPIADRAQVAPRRQEAEEPLPLARGDPGRARRPGIAARAPSPQPSPPLRGGEGVAGVLVPASRSPHRRPRRARAGAPPARAARAGRGRPARRGGARRRRARTSGSGARPPRRARRAARTASRRARPGRAPRTPGRSRRRARGGRARPRPGARARTARSG